MPLKKGKSNATREANIEREIAAGKPPEQAVAIGYSVQRKARGMAGGGVVPSEAPGEIDQNRTEPPGYAEGGEVDESAPTGDAAAAWQKFGDVWVSDKGDVSETDPTKQPDAASAAGRTDLATHASTVAATSPATAPAGTTTALAEPTPQETLGAIATQESGGDYTAKNHASSAAGKYQMLKGTARQLAADPTVDLAPFAREALTGAMTAPDSNNAEYQDWLASHPGVQEQLAQGLFHQLRTTAKAKAAPTAHEAARQIFTDWNFGRNTDLADTTPVPNNPTRAERAAAFDKAIAAFRAQAPTPMPAPAPDVAGGGAEEAPAEQRPGVDLPSAGGEDATQDVRVGIDQPPPNDLTEVGPGKGPGLPTPEQARAMLRAGAASYPGVNDAAINPERWDRAQLEDLAAGRTPTYRTTAGVNVPARPAGVEPRPADVDSPEAIATKKQQLNMTTRDEPGTPQAAAAQKALDAMNAVAGGEPQPIEPAKLVAPPPSAAPAPATPAHANEDSLDKQYRDVLNELTLQRKSDATWSAQKETELTKMRADALSGKIDPNHIFASKSTGARIMAAVSVALGAFGAALAHTPNYAQEMLSAAINSDIEAQKEQLGRKASLYSVALSQYGNERQARQAATAILWDQARAIGQEMRFQNVGVLKAQNKALTDTARLAAINDTIDQVEKAYNSYAPGGTGAWSFAQSKLLGKLGPNPWLANDLQGYQSAVLRNARNFMSLVPGARVNDETIALTSRLFPSPDVDARVNRERIAGLRASAGNLAVMAGMLQKAGVPFDDQGQGAPAEVAP